MKKEVEIKKIGINGEGIGYLDKKITFVKGALPDETVMVDITKSTRTFHEGKHSQNHQAFKRPGPGTLQAI